MSTEPVQLSVPFALQKKWYWCGPTCLSLVAKYWGKEISASEFAESSGTDERVGTSCAAMSGVARKKGFWVFETMNGSLDVLYKLLAKDIPSIALVYQEHAKDRDYGELDRYHYVVVTGSTNTNIIFHDVDPADDGGRKDDKMPREDFLRMWRAELGASGKWLLALALRQVDERFVPPYFTGEPHAS